LLSGREVLVSDIKRAEELHGHLGPFLVIGVRMGEIAGRFLNVEGGNSGMRVMVRVPLVTPFSCILDGIQAVTRCTVGNRRLKIRNSDGPIMAVFKLKGCDKTLRVLVRPQLIEVLRKRLMDGDPNEELAWEVASMPEETLFELSFSLKRKKE